MSQGIFSSFMSHLKAGNFVFTGELEPEKTTDLASTIKTANFLKDFVVACNVTDNPQSFGYISSLIASYVVQRETEMESIYQLT
ncbi:MAG: hypothetical protein ACFFC7_33050 [Candidatus Hermodarchaeota archaeon]